MGIGAIIAVLTGLLDPVAHMGALFFFIPYKRTEDKPRVITISRIILTGVGFILISVGIRGQEEPVYTPVLPFWIMMEHLRGNN